MASDINGAARHTPGDWYATVREGASMVMVRNPDGSERIIAMDLFDEDASPEIEEVEANSHLMAASPDLLAACEAVRGDVEAWALHLNDTGRLKASQDAMVRWDNVRAAIAKARQGGGA